MIARAAGGRPGVVRAVARTAPALLLAACVTSYEDAPLFGAPAAPPPYAAAVTIPFGEPPVSADQTLVAEFYRGVLRRLHEAAQERDVGQLEALLANYERPDVPLALRERLQGYRGVARGLRFTRFAAQNAEIVQLPATGPDAPPREADAPALGAPLQLELRLPAPPERVVLGGRDDEDPVRFLVSISVEDAFVEGSSRSSSTQEFVGLPTRIELAGDTVLRLPIAVELTGGTAVRRDVYVRVDLMPGHVGAEAGRAPVPQTAIAAVALTQWPVGYGAVAAKPLQELRAALQNFEPKHFPRAFLAASATRGDEREAAIDLLVEQVRFGRPDQAQVAMAALRAITGIEFPIGDREAWLAWSRDRR